MIQHIQHLLVFETNFYFRLLLVQNNQIPIQQPRLLKAGFYFTNSFNIRINAKHFIYDFNIILIVLVLLKSIHNKQKASTVQK